MPSTHGTILASLPSTQVGAVSTVASPLKEKRAWGRAQAQAQPDHSMHHSLVVCPTRLLKSNKLWLQLPSHPWSSTCHGSNSQWISDSGHILPKMCVQWSSPWAHASVLHSVSDLYCTSAMMTFTGHVLTRSNWACTLCRCCERSCWCNALTYCTCVMNTWMTYCYICTYIDTYIHTYIHRYSKFTTCYSCIQGSLWLARNYDVIIWYPLHCSWYERKKKEERQIAIL